MASTSLGTLTLDLAVRLSEFTDGLSRAERETRDRTENMGESVSRFKEQLIEDLSGTPIGSAIDMLNDKLGSISEAFGENGIVGAAKIGAAGVIAATVGMGFALTTLAVQVAETDAQLEMLANRANISTTQFQVLGAATSKYGIDNEGLSDILADVQEKLGEFAATGAGGLLDTLELLQNNTKMSAEEVEAFGVSLSNVDGATAIQMVNDKLEELGATAQVTRFTMESMASGLGDISDVWQNGGKIIEEYEAKLYSAGVIRTQDAIDQSKLLRDQTLDMQAKFQGLTYELVNYTTPALNSVIGYFSEGAKQGDGFASSVGGVGVVVSGVAKIIIGFSSVVNMAVIGFQGLMDQFYVLGQTGTAFLNADGLFGKIQALQNGSASFAAAGVATDRRFAAEAERAANAINNTGSIRMPTNVGGSNSELERLRREAELLQESNIISTKTADDNAKAMEKQAKAADKNTDSLKKQAEAQARLVGISGDTGIGNAHLHIQYRDKSRAVSQSDMDRFRAGDKKITDYRKTSDFGPRNTGIKGASTNHRGTDFAIPKNTPITTNVAVKGVKTWKDSNGGGYVSTVTFDDGVVIDLLHQMPGVMGVEKGATTGNSAIDSATSKAQAIAQKAMSDAEREREKAAAEEKRALEELERAKLSITQKYASDKEKIESEHTNNVIEIERLYAEGSSERTKYLAREKERYEIEKNAGLLAVSEKYFSEEQRIHDAHKKAMAVIDKQFAENDPNRQLYVDLQNAAYQEDLANFRFAAGAKARERDKMYQSIANSAKANGISALSTGKNSMMQRTLGDEDYQQWRLNQDYVEGFDSVNNDYKNREAEINAVDERGKEAFPELERFELLEIAKQEHLDKMWALEQEYALKDQTLAEQHTAQRVAIYKSLFAGMTNAASVFFGENSRMHKIAFAAEQAYAVHKALMNVEETYSNTFNSLSAIPLIGPYIAAPGAAVAAGIQVASAGRIQGMSAPSVAGIAHGGLDNVPAEATYLLQKDERVLSPKQNKDLVKFMANSQKASSGGITINNNSRAEVSARQNPDGTVTVDMVDKMIEKSFRRIGRANSLESKSIQRGTTARVNRR